MTEVNSTDFKATTTALYADNSTGQIGAGDLRAQMDDIADSVPFKKAGFTTAPTVNDDVDDTAGNGEFQVGDFWIDETADKAYVCVDSSTGAAVWIETTFIDVGNLSPTAAPAYKELAIWVDGNTLRGFDEIQWDDAVAELQIDGDIVFFGSNTPHLVDGRDVAVDGAKLDNIAVGAINTITFADEPVDGSSGTSFTAIKLRVVVDDGLFIVEESGEALIELRNNDITADTGDRTLASTDNFSFITNEGAGGTVIWSLPLTTALYSTPRLVATFFKVANQTMQIKGVNTVTVNGLTESGGNESLITICPTPYDTFAVVVYSGVSDTYFVYQGTDISKVATTANTELAFWTGDGTIDGAPELLWDGTTLDIAGQVKSNWAFNAQSGTSYTAVLSDRGKIVTMNNGAGNVFTIPDSTAVAYPVGTEIRVIMIGAGATTITGSSGGGGVTVNGVSQSSGIITAVWDEVRLYKVATDTWYAVGEVGTFS